MIPLSPPLVLAGVVTGVYAGLFHLLVRHNNSELLLYWIAALVGFGLGQLASMLYSVELYRIGSLHIVEGTIGAWVAMNVANWLKL